MDKLLYLLPALMCPFGMGAAVWLMMHGIRGETPESDTADQEQELARLRKEVEALRAEQASRIDLSKGAAT
jgi:hypothetical protein